MNEGQALETKADKRDKCRTCGSTYVLALSNAAPPGRQPLSAGRRRPHRDPLNRKIRCVHYHKLLILVELLAST